MSQHNVEHTPHQFPLQFRQNALTLSSCVTQHTRKHIKYEEQTATEKMQIHSFCTSRAAVTKTHTIYHHTRLRLQCVYAILVCDV